MNDTFFNDSEFISIIFTIFKRLNTSDYIAIDRTLSCIRGYLRDSLQKSQTDYFNCYL
jgi:hypothetical protein